MVTLQVLKRTSLKITVFLDAALTDITEVLIASITGSSTSDENTKHL
jgi:hypothetical protein